MDPQIDDYIRANSDKYTREAIRERLIAAGHDIASVDAAWARVDAATPPQPVPRALRGRYWLAALAGYLVVAALLVLWLVSRPSAFRYGVGQTVLALLGVEMLLGLAISGALGQRRLGTRGLGALSVPIVTALLLGGACLATMTAFNF